MEKQNSFVRFMLLFGIMLIVMQLSMRWLGFGPENPPNEQAEEQTVEAVSTDPVLVGDQDETFVALGSFDPEKNEKYLAYFSTRGASLDRIELVERHDDGHLKYGVIEFKHGYLGYLAPIALTKGELGIKVRVVGDGTPAHTAGIQIGDVLTSIADRPLATVQDMDNALLRPQPGEKVEVKYKRGGEVLTVQVELAEKPLQVIDPQPFPPVDPEQEVPPSPDYS